VQGFLPSPTFHVLYRYEGASAAVVHTDLYRIHDPDELKELGWDELGGDDEIVLIEWPERAGGLLPGDRWDIELRVLDEEPGVRRVSLRRVGAAPAIPPPSRGMPRPG
jgi:tRNA threonylcarbamoyl adenosine modification protein YjeE